MHPAISVIFFTVISGAGFGGIFWIGAGLADGASTPLRLAAMFLAGGMAIAGLLSSTLHLGHPERAWRAFSQWRSSWLSREGVLAIACLSAFGFHALLWLTGYPGIFIAGWLAGLLALTTVFATAMIYAQLRTVPLWNQWLTPAVYLGFSLSSGFLLVAAFSPPTTFLGWPLAIAAVLLLCIAWSLKASWRMNGRCKTLETRGSDIGSATGLGALGKVRLLERPHTGENYLTREMVHKIGRKHAAKLEMLAVFLGLVGAGLVCLAVWALALPNGFLAIAFLLQIAGLFFERWLFFAEAKHSVSLYYD